MSEAQHSGVSSTRKLRQLFEASSDGMLLVDPDGVITEANASAERMLRTAPGGLSGVPVADLFHPLDWRLSEALEELKTEGRFDGNLLVRRLSGPAATTKVSLRGGEGFGMSVIFQEIGEIEPFVESWDGKTPESDEAGRLEALLDSVHDFIALADENNVALYANEAIERIMGYKPEEFVGTVIASYLHPDDMGDALAAVARTLSESGPQSLGVYRYRHKNGSWRYLETLVNNRLDDPAIGGVICNCRDVTDRVQAEERLRESEERFRALVENAQDFVVLADENNVATYASPAIERILGYAPEEFVGTVVASYGHPDEAEAASTITEVVPIPGPHNLGAWRYRCKDGTYRYLEVVVNNRLDDPALRGVVCNCRDVTERVEAETKLRESEEWFRTLIQNAPDMIFVLERDNSIRYASPSVGKVLGYAPGDLLGEDVRTYLHPEDLDEAQSAVLASDGDPGAVGIPGPLVRVRHKDGSWRTVEGFLTNLLDDPNVQGLVFNSRDVTERVEAEERLRKSEETHRALSENALDFVVVQKPDNTLSYVSPSIERLLGWRPEEALGKMASEYIHPEDLEWAWPVFYKQLQTPGIHEGVEIRYRHKDGSWRWYESHCNNQLDNPAVGGLVFNCRDVTERVEAEERLRESEERFRALIENGADLVVVQLPDGSMSFASPSVERLLGYTPEEFTAMLPHDIIHPEDLPGAVEALTDVLEVPNAIRSRTLRYRHKDGSYRTLDTVCKNRVEDPGIGGLVFNCRDVTEKVAAEEKLRRSEERYRGLSENALDLVAVLGVDNTITYASPSFETLLGLRPEDLVGTVAADYIHPEDLEWAWPLFYEAIQDPEIVKTVVIRYRHRDGSWRWFESAFSNQFDNPAVGGLVFNCRDVTERVQAEERLREAEERFRLLVEQVPAATYIERGDTDSSTIYVSPQIEALLGYTPDEWLADPGLWLRSLHPEDHGRVFARHLRCNETGEPFEEEYRAFGRDGREVWVRDEARLVCGESGEPLYWQGVKVDITSRKRAELEILRLNTDLRGQVAGYTAELKAAIESIRGSEAYLRAREERYHATFEQAAVGIAHVTPEGRWLRVNEKLCEILGYGREDLLKRTFRDITHPDDLRADLDGMRRLLDGETGTYSIEKRYLRGDGGVVWASLTVSLVRDAAGDPDYFISVIDDVSRRKEAEALLAALSPRELEVLGGIVQGKTNAEIADEMRYSANTIKTYVRNITEKLGATDRTQAAVYAAETGLFSPGFRVPEVRA